MRTRQLHASRVKLPWECVELIIEECDQATRATLGRVSLDFLKATAPLLYKDVEIRSIKDLKQLFCDRSVRLRGLSPPITGAQRG